MSINPSKANASTTQTFVTSLVTNAGLLIVQVGIFIYLKQHLGRVYSPRTYLPPPDKRAEDVPRGVWRWVPAVLLTNPHEIIHFNGLDAYLFLRFLRMLMIIFSFFTLVTYPILLPTDSAAVPGANASDGLEKLSWANLTSASQDRYAAHLIIIWILTAFVVFMARHEMLHFVHMRHQFLISKAHSKQANARTVLITNLPSELDSEHALMDWASFVPGGIERTWLYRDTRDLNKLFERREKACASLEKVTSNLLRAANHAWSVKQATHRKEVKRLQQAQKQELGAPQQAQKKGRTSSEVDPETVVGGPGTTEIDEHDLVPAEASWELLEELVPLSKRPQTRPGKFGWAKIGSKYDAYGYFKDEIAKLNEEIKTGRAQMGKRKSLGTAFLECNLQLGAHVLAQCVSYHEPLVMANKWIEVSPKDVIWDNLDDPAIEVWTRYLSSWFLTICLIVLWAFPVAFVGTLSNISDLCAQFHWLEWICKAPTPAPGIISGVLPPLFLAILMLILPVLLRGLAWYENIPLKSLLSVSVYKRYYAFLVIHGFLIVTFSSAITATIWSILHNPAKTVEDLAARLPDASIFFLTYMVTQGLSGAASALIQLGALVLHYYQKWYAGRTPRQAYKATFVMPSADFGVVLPRISLLATIGLAYSVISPVINGLAVVSFFLFFLSWKFLFKYVFDQPDEMETGGMYFPLAVGNLFVGLYIAQISMTCLLALKIATTSDNAIFIAEVVLMVLLILLTFGAQVFIRHTFEPIQVFLPMSLATQKANERYRKRLAAEQADSAAAIVDKVGEEVVDLFNRDRLKGTLRRRMRLRPEKNADGHHAQHEEARKHAEEKEQLENGTHTKGEAMTEQERIRKQAERDHPTMFAQGGGSSTPGATVAASDAPNTPDTAVSPATARAASGTTPLLPTQDTVETTNSRQLLAPKDTSEPDHPHHLQTAPPAPALRDPGEEDAEEEYEENAFNHPATYQDQPWIWLPHDPLGFATIFSEDLRAVGVDASDLGSTMDTRGTVEVNRSPPDEGWAGGVDR